MKYDMRGVIFNIQRFCVQDGPGIRTTVFLKGCPLRCAWCHNPESHRAQAELLYLREKCALCGACEAVCPNGCHAVTAAGHAIDRTACTACGKCAGACPAGALEISGRIAESHAVMETVLRDKPFYEDSGGGLTISGGEPMAQPDFTRAIAEEARTAGISVCVETSGYCPTETLPAVMEHVDLFLFDCKLTDAALHKKWCGADNALILQNLRFLSDHGKTIILRCPVIPGVNMTEEHLSGIAETALAHPGVVQIDLEPYHPLGIEKSARLGRTSGYGRKDFLEGNALEPWRDYLTERTKLPVNIL